jgi:hypothetical protein
VSPSNIQPLRFILTRLAFVAVFPNIGCRRMMPLSGYKTPPRHILSGFDETAPQLTSGIAASKQMPTSAYSLIRIARPVDYGNG